MQIRLFDTFSTAYLRGNLKIQKKRLSTKNFFKVFSLCVGRKASIRHFKSTIAESSFSVYNHFYEKYYNVVQACLAENCSNISMEYLPIGGGFCFRDKVINLEISGRTNNEVAQIVQDCFFPEAKYISKLEWW